MVRNCLVRQQLKVLRKILQAAALHNIPHRWVEPAFSLVHPWFVKQLQLGKSYGNVFEGTKLLKECCFANK